MLCPTVLYRHHLDITSTIEKIRRVYVASVSQSKAGIYVDGEISDNVFVPVIFTTSSCVSMCSSWKRQLFL